MSENSITTSAGLRTRTGTGLALVLGSIALTIGVVALAILEAPPPERGLTAVVYALGVALPTGLGIFRLSQHRNDRFAWLLVGAGLLWSLTALALAGNSTLYSIGRESVWLFEVLLVYLMLAFPLGRLTTTTERRIFGALALVVAVLYVPTGLVAPYPEPSPWATCGTDCPPNAFALVDESPALVDELVRPLRELLVVLLYLAVAVVITRRARTSGPLGQRGLAPVAAVAAYHFVAVLAYQSLRAADSVGLASEIIGWLFVLTLPALTLSFAAGLLRQRLFVASALEHLAVGLKQHASAHALRGALAQALHDPSLRVLYWMESDGGGRWIDETGSPVGAPAPGPRVAITEVADEGRRIAAISHDAALDPVLVQAAGSYALAALENERLASRLDQSLSELAASRARIVAVADGERRRIERNLHDGAQQRLVALRIKMELLAERIQTKSPGTAGAIRALENDVEGTIDEVRSFARGIYPPLLAERGLSEALRAAGRAAPVPTMVDAAGLRRFRPEIEATVYFACMEALQNVAKHATGSTGVVIRATQNPHLRFSVSDDGGGFDSRTISHGDGLTNLRDRLEAVGGELLIESEIGKGTTVTGTIPVE